MSTNFPTSLDTLTVPSGSDTLGGSTPTHTQVHDAANDAIEALEAKVGADASAVTSSLDYKIAHLQPLDSDLTAIAALSTSSFGRSFLALADAAAARTLVAQTAALTPFTPQGSIAATDVQSAIQEVRDEASGGGSGVLAAMFGDGSDGDVTITGTVTLSRDMYYNNLTCAAGQILETASYRVFVRGTLTLGGTIRNNGAAAAVTVGGQAAANGFWLSTQTAPNGGTTTGSAGPNETYTLGGAGGLGGTGASGAGGAGGTVSAPDSYGGGVGAFRNAPAAILGRLFNINAVVLWRPSASGGSGGGDGTAGGGGGGGGQAVGVYARLVTGAGTISANGGAGGVPAAGNRGGGGGGGGGVAILVTTSTAHSFTITAAGGTGGAKTGTGTAGADGSAGRTYVLLGV